MDRLRVGLRDGKNRLPDHALEQALADCDALFAADRRQIRVFVRGNSHDREFARAAFDGGDVFLVDREVNRVARQTAHNVAEQAGAQHDRSRFLDGRFEEGRHAQLQIIAAQRQVAARRAQKNSFERRDRRFGRDGALHIAYSFDELLAAAKYFHSFIT